MGVTLVGKYVIRQNLMQIKKVNKNLALIYLIKINYSVNTILF